MKTNEPLPLPVKQAEFILDAIHDAKAELDALQRTESWFVSDALDKLLTATEMLHSLLGIIIEVYDDEDDEPEQYPLELRFD